MKKELMIISIGLFFILGILLVSASTNQNSNGDNNLTKQETYVKCLKDCLTEKNKAHELCIENHKNETRVCILQKLDCNSELRINHLNKTINISGFTKGKKECSRTYLNCSKVLDQERKVCFNTVKDVKCERKCKEELCTQIYEPVCGKLNVQCFAEPCPDIIKTFSNMCELKKAGAKFLYKGICVNKSEVCFSNSDCKADEFCEFQNCNINFLCKDKKCYDLGIPQVSGKCIAVPQVCPLEVGKPLEELSPLEMAYQPVCGCDGKTYGSECERQMAKVTKRYDGECPPEPIKACNISLCENGEAIPTGEKNNGCMKYKCPETNPVA